MATMTPHAGQRGVPLRVKFLDETGAVEDVSAATTREIYLKDPAGTTSTLTASFTTDGTDGLIEFVTLVGTLGSSGCWKIQGHAASASVDWDGVANDFTVLAKLV